MLTMGTIISLLDPFDALASAAPALTSPPSLAQQQQQPTRRVPAARLAPSPQNGGGGGCGVSAMRPPPPVAHLVTCGGQPDSGLLVAADSANANANIGANAQQPSGFASGSRRASAHAHQQQREREQQAAVCEFVHESAAAASCEQQRRREREQQQQQQQRPQQQQRTAARLQQQQQKNKAEAAGQPSASRTKTKTKCVQASGVSRASASELDTTGAFKAITTNPLIKSDLLIINHPTSIDGAQQHLPPGKKVDKAALKRQQQQQATATMTVLANKQRPVVGSSHLQHHNHHNHNHHHNHHHHHHQKQQQQQRQPTFYNNYQNNNTFAGGDPKHHRRSFQGSMLSSSAASNYHNHHQQTPHQYTKIAQGRKFHRRSYTPNHPHSSASSTVSSDDNSSGLPESSGPATPDNEEQQLAVGPPRPPALPTKRMMALLCSKAAAELMAYNGRQQAAELEMPAAHVGWFQWCRSLGDRPAFDHPSVHPAPPPRHWLYLEPSSARPASHHFHLQQPQPEFTVLSYNILADRMVNSKHFPSSPQMALNWFYRRELILRQLNDFDADIVALQEVEQQHYDNFFRPNMEARGYGCLFGPKSRIKTMEAHKRLLVDGCAIFYKHDKFALVQQHLLEYNQIAMANAKGSEAMLNRVMTKDNIGLAAILELRPPQGKQPSDGILKQPQRLLVCNTHIHWDPEYCDVKLIQTIMLMNELECIAKHHLESMKYPTSPQPQQPQPYQQLLGGDSMNFNSNYTTNDLLPLVLLGDFNSMPNSGVTTYLTGGRIDSLHEDFKNEKYTSCSNALAIRATQLEQHQADIVFINGQPQTIRRQSSPAWCFYQPQSASPPTSGHLSHLSGNISPTTSTTGSSTSSYRSSFSIDETTSTHSSSPSQSHYNHITPPPTTATTDNVLNYQHEFKLASAYDEQLMPYTNYTCNFKAMIDYIFYSQSSLELVGLLGPFEKDWLRRSGIQGLPQAHLPSDHLPLMARLRLGARTTTIKPQNHS